MSETTCILFLSHRYLQEKKHNLFRTIIMCHFRLSSSQENKDQLLHCVACLCGPACVRPGDAVRRHWTAPAELELRRDLLPGADLTGCPADHSLHPPPLLHLSGQVTLPVWASDPTAGAPLEINIHTLSPFKLIMEAGEERKRESRRWGAETVSSVAVV